MAGITFFEKYHQTDSWYEKVIILEIYHCVRLSKNPQWTMGETAKDFNVSIGLVSENLRIAEAMHKDKDLINVGSRQKALIKLGIISGRNVETSDD